VKLMRLRYFLLGLLIGLAIAPADGRTTWRRLRDLLAKTIDAALQFGMAPPS
jgi:hypothetical protein